jgi:hypothetical protein
MSEHANSKTSFASNRLLLFRVATSIRKIKMKFKMGAWQYGNHSAAADAR